MQSEKKNVKKFEKIIKIYCTYNIQVVPILVGIIIVCKDIFMYKYI